MSSTASAEGHYQQGLAYVMMGQLPEAARAFTLALQLRPDHAEAHNNLGVVLAAQGRLDEAAASYAAALRLVPGHVEAHNNLAVVHTEQGRLDEATTHAEEALRWRPAFAEAHYNLGNIRRLQGRYADAEECYRQAVLLRPHYPEAHNNLGLVLGQLGRLDDAAASYRQALAVQPAYAEAHNNLGVALQALGRTGEANPCFQEALRLQPGFADALNNLGNSFKDSGQVEEAVRCLEEALALEPANAAIHSNLLLALHYHPSYESQPLLFSRHRHWAAVHAEPLVRAHAAPAPDRTPGRRLRLGYVSPDFRQHPVASCLELVLAAHDRERFELFCYSDVTRPDAVTERLRGHADHWRSLVGLTDAAAAEMIRADRIDLLVDLAGHTANHRLLAFARRPAPVQATFLGYPDTTGLSAIDYRITDCWSDSPGFTERYHTEELIRLPDIAWCYRPPDEAPEVNDLPALRTGRFTFACLNNTAKVTEPALILWARILRALPNARLLLLGGTGGTEDPRLGNVCTRCGLPADRVAFVGKISREAYFRLHHTIDLALDPFPYNGAVTTCDALWMGVPVIALAGGTCCARQGLSLLCHLDLQELIAQSPDEYVDIAQRLAGDLRRLRDVRPVLRKWMRSATLTDGQRFTLHLEAAYLHMWEHGGRKPALPAEQRARRTWADIPGWFDFADFYRRVVAAARPGAVFVEVGCWLGRSTAFLAQAIRDAGKDIRLYAVEHGLGSPGGADQRFFQHELDRHGGTVAGALHRNLLDCGVADLVVPIIAPSARAAELFAPGSVDFVFLDGDHRYDAVLHDLRLWWDKLRPGGVLAGHDYTAGWPEVVRAVHDFFGAERVTAVERSCWMVLRDT